MNQPESTADLILAELALRGMKVVGLSRQPGAPSRTTLYRYLKRGQYVPLHVLQAILETLGRAGEFKVRALVPLTEEVEHRLNVMSPVPSGGGVINPRMQIDTIVLVVDVPREAHEAFTATIGAQLKKGWSPYGYPTWVRGLQSDDERLRIAWRRMTERGWCQATFDLHQDEQRNVAHWKIIRQLVHSFGTDVRVSRVDVALDYPVQMRSLLMNRHLATYDTHTSSEGLVTLYLGAPGSDLLVRVYDRARRIAGKSKLARAGTAAGHTTRVEAQVKPRPQRSVVATLQRLNDDAHNPFRMLQAMEIESVGLEPLERILLNEMRSVGFREAMRSWPPDLRATARRALARAHTASRLARPGDVFRTLWRYAAEELLCCLRVDDRDEEAELLHARIGWDLAGSTWRTSI